MSVVTPAIVQHVARLARLQVEGPALDQLASQLDHILQYVQQLQAVATDRVEPTSHVLPIANVLRADEPCASLSQADVTAFAPAAQPPFIKVPKVIET